MKCDICQRKIEEYKRATWYEGILVCAECSSIKTAKEIFEEVGPLPKIILSYLEAGNNLVEMGVISEEEKNHAMIAEEKRFLVWEGVKANIIHEQLIQNK